MTDDIVYSIHKTRSGLYKLIGADDLTILDAVVDILMNYTATDGSVIRSVDRSGALEIAISHKPKHKELVSK